MQQPLPLRLAPAAFLALALVAPALRADPDVVFSNVNATVCHCGALIGGQSYSYPQSVAEAFTPTADYQLTGAEARLDGYGTGGTVDLAIYSNSSGHPGASLASLGSVSLSAADEGVFSPSGPIPPLALLSGAQYWLVLNPGTAGTLFIWEGAGSSSVPCAGTADTTGASGWVFLGPENLQFEIDGTPVVSAVPEPAAVWLLLPTVVFICFKLRKRRA